MKFAGSTFHYERKPHAFIAPETITALGPTSEALYVVLLYQEPNPGIEYEYSFPKDVQLPTGGDSYNWIYGSWSDCTASCGGGKSNLIFSLLTGKRLNANVDQGSKREMSVAPRRAISKWSPTNCATLNWSRQWTKRAARTPASPVGSSVTGQNARATAKRESSSVPSTANKSPPVPCNRSLTTRFASTPSGPDQCPLRSATKKPFARHSTWENGDL